MNKKRLSICLVLLVVFALAMSGCGKQEEEQNIQSEQSSESSVSLEEEKEKGLQFPYELEDGKLTVNSLFPSSVDNPDAGWEYGDDIATLEVVNTSDEFLTEAEITVKLLSGIKISFDITNIPAGKSVWVFAKDNTAVEMDAPCEEMTSSAKFENNAPSELSGVSVQTDGTKITISNQTSNSIENITIGCHCLFDEVYFGGLTYSYSVDELPANSSEILDAEDCYLGGAEVVCISSK